MISCYETSINYYIVCFFKNTENKYIMIVYSQDLVEQANTELGEDDSENNHFFKCAHFFEETGVFAYFNKNEPYELTFQFKTYSSNSISDFNENIPYLSIDNYNFNRYISLNDIVKAKDKKIYYVGVTEDKKILYIISIINYSEEKLSIRIYRINMYNLYNYAFFFDIGIVVYKNFLALGSSFNIGEDGTSYSSLIIFSYPNTTNVSFEISEYLFNNNNIKINNLEIELIGEYIMENNIFGYVFSGIQILENCNLTVIYLVNEDGEKIINPYFLEKNQTIKLIIPKSNEYNPFNCTFKYASIVREPEYDKFNEYPEKIVDTAESDKENLFFDSIKNNYIGKHSYYNLFLENKLTEDVCGRKL